MSNLFTSRKDITQLIRFVKIKRFRRKFRPEYRIEADGLRYFELAMKESDEDDELKKKEKGTHSKDMEKQKEI